MDVERRARVHGALADPTRLRIVDRLAEGDASPSELQVMLAISSNLLAHHLAVLTRSGLVARHRSEADRRRSYLRLLPELLAAPGAGGARAVPRVLFVCTANSARSQLAAALWARSSDIPVASAGTQPAAGVAPGALRVARRRGLELVGDRPQHLAEVAATSDYLVSVCDRAYEELGAEGVQAHWSVPDPVRIGTAAAYDAACDDLALRVAHLAPRLTTAS